MKRDSFSHQVKNYLVVIHPTQFPMSMYLVAGTQADRAHNNKIVMMKLSQMHKTKHDAEDSGTYYFYLQVNIRTEKRGTSRSVSNINVLPCFVV